MLGSPTFRRMITDPLEDEKTAYQGVLAELEARLLGGESPVLRDVLRLLGTRIERVIRGRLGKLLTDADYEDAMSIALFRLWQRRDRFDPSRSRLDRWFYVLARNAALDLLRHRSRRHEETVGDELEHLPAPEDHVHRGGDSQLYRDLREALARLSEMDRRILLSGLPETQLSRELGLKPGTIRVRRSRTKEKLRSVLRDLGHT